GPAVRVRQRRVRLHAERLGGPRVQAPFQRRDDRHQRRRAGADGLVPVHRLEPVVLRRPAHPGDGRGPLLYATENDDDPLVRLAARVAPRPGVEDRENLKTRPDRQPPLHAAVDCPWLKNLAKSVSNLWSHPRWRAEPRLTPPARPILRSMTF